MPTIEALMDIEGQVEAAFASHLNANGFAVNETDETGILVTPRVEIVAVVSGEGPHESRVGTVGVYDQFAVDVSFNLIVSPRGPSPQNPALLRGKLRALLLNYPAINALLADLSIGPESFRASGGSRIVEADEDHVVMQVQKSLQVFVKPASWPASVVPVVPAP